MFLLVCGIILLSIYLLLLRVERTFNLLEGLSDDINEIRMKLGLGMHYRTEPQAKRSIAEDAKRCLVAGGGIEEIKDYCFPKRFPNDISTEESREKYDKFIRELIKDFEEAKICPQCKDIYYEYAVVEAPYTQCLKCKTGDNKYVKLITTAEYKQRKCK